MTAEHKDKILLSTDLHYENPSMGIALTATVLFGSFSTNDAARDFYATLIQDINSAPRETANEVRKFVRGGYTRARVHYYPLSIPATFVVGRHRDPFGIFRVSRADFDKMQDSLWKVLSPKTPLALVGRRPDMLKIITAHMMDRFAPPVLKKYVASQI